MKKIIFVFISFFISLTFVKASSFYLADPIDGVYVMMDKGTSKSFQKFKPVYKNGSNELVYCVEPGVKLSNEEYDSFESFNERFYIDQEKMDKVKLIAYYGYLYADHTDFSWYIATQFLIWDTVKSRYWDIYFTDQNQNRIDNPYTDKINKINRLINSHNSKPNISDYYEFNYKDKIEIFDDAYIINNYKSADFEISGNKITISDNLEPGTYLYKAELKSNKVGLFYNHPLGQDLYEKGYVYDKNISFNIHITSGNLIINECTDDDFNNYFIGGSYEVLDQDDNVIEEITCKENKECKINNLPTGYFKIRVKSLNDDFIENKYIYDVLISDSKTSSVNICSLKKKIETNNKEDVEEEGEYDEIYMPSTYKSNIFGVSTFLVLLFLSYKGGMKYKNL